MIYRFMRLILFFDLPVQTATQLKAYQKFLRNIKKEGFIMMQKSVYSKLVDTSSKSKAVLKKVNQLLPTEGRVDVLVITEKQFSSINVMLGERKSSILDTDERLVEI